MDALRDNKLVVFAGAGISMGEPACLPDFKRLAREIASGTGAEPQEGETEDRFLGRLRQQNGTDVHTLAAEALSRDCLKPNDLHYSLLRLFARDQSVRLVTTNFDELFERVADTEDLFDAKPEVFRAPALPLGHDFNGIVHLHGAVSRPHGMVLTDEDFGRAYLTEGWARRFLVSLFREYTVLFVGYSHSDTDMHYLARALPVSEAKRFALIGSDDNDIQLWESRGIYPISYPKPGREDFSALDEGVERLADTVRRGFLEWKNVIRGIARSAPPVSKEDADIIEEALRDPVKTRFFVEHASSPEWIDWLDQRAYLDGLFSKGVLSERDGFLSWWIASRFACKSLNKVFRLIGKHNSQLSPSLWWKIGHNVRKGEAELDGQSLSRWVSVLLNDLPENKDSHHILSTLGGLCVKHGSFNTLLQLFGAMTASRLVLKPGFPLDEEQETPIRAELPMVGATYVLWKIWRDCLEPNIEQVGEPLLRTIVVRLEERHRALLMWGRSENWERPAIEAHYQNRSTGISTIFVDAARCTLKWLTKHQSKVADSWCDQLASSDAPLLRRLAIHTLIERENLSADEKINWLLTKLDIHDAEVHHEVFRLAGQYYPGADQTHKRELISAIHSYQWEGETRSRLSGEELTAWHHLNWFHWLHVKDPDCLLAKQARDEASAMLPGYEPREHPDFLSWVGPLPETGPTVGELLRRPAGVWLEELGSFLIAEQSGHARFVFERNLHEAAKKNLEWGIALAEALANATAWNSGLWPPLLHAWRDLELEEEESLRILYWLGKAELYGDHSYEVANVLFSLVQNRGKPHLLKHLSLANEIAMAVWQELDHDELDEEHDDWIRRAHDHTAGRITEFWLHGLSVWRNAQDPLPTALNDEYRAMLSAIVQEHTLPGKLGLSILFGEFAFLLTADREWTVENLLPSFNPNSATWEVARESLARILIDPNVANLLDKAFLEAVQWSSSQGEYVRDQFIQRYTYMIAYFVEDPLETWIPKLFRYGGEDIGEVFTSSFNENFLRDMDEATQLEWWQGWMKDYWESRLRGVPIALSPKEIAHMLHWPAQLTAVFPEAVDLAVEMEVTTSEYGNLIFYLDENKLVERFPNEMAGFLLHLDKIGVQEHWWEARDILNSLLESSVSDDVKHKLRELMAKREIDE